MNCVSQKMAFFPEWKKWIVPIRVGQRTSWENMQSVTTMRVLDWVGKWPSIATEKYLWWAINHVELSSVLQEKIAQMLFDKQGVSVEVQA